MENYREIITEVTEYYTQKLREHGTTPRGVDWNSNESQWLRFEQLSKVIAEDSEHFSALDFGSGFGAMLEFLTARYGDRFSYTGFDIAEEMIEAGRQKFSALQPQPSWVSRAEDLTTYDYVLVSGIFNVKNEFSTELWEEYIYKTLDQINSLAVKGFAFNILTSYSDPEYMKPNLYYADPRVIFDYCKRNFSKYVAVLHDYPLYEFTVIVRK